MSEKHNGPSENPAGVGFLGLLFLVLMTLKITGHIEASWWLVSLPLWAIPALILVIGVIFLLGCVILAVRDYFVAAFSRARR